MLKKGVMLVVAILLMAVNFFKLWQIRLIAPQYPEGLNLTILTHGWGDLQQKKLIDDLNHYIGMHPLPEHIAEFTILPLVFVFFSVTALLLAIWYRKTLIRLWFVLYTLFGVIALADFYKWLYKYGHDLSPDAALKIDPFTPPLIGKKILMNFTVYSYPHIGGWMAILSAVLVFVLIILDRK